MRTVKIISGGYGYRAGEKKSVELKDSRSAPFELNDTEAARIVALGIAEYAEIEVATPVPDTKAETTGVNTTEAVNTAEGEYEGDIPDLDNMSFAELKAEATRRGIKAGKFKSKLALREAILEADDEPFSVGAEEPVI